MRCSWRSGRISKRWTSHQLTSAAIAHISTGSRISACSATVIDRAGELIRTSIGPLPGAIERAYTPPLPAVRAGVADEDDLAPRRRSATRSRTARLRCAARRRVRHAVSRVVALPPATPVRSSSERPSSAIHKRMSLGAVRGGFDDVGKVADRTDRLAVDLLDLEAARDRGRDGERGGGIVARRRAAGPERGIGGDAQRQRIARDQAFERGRGQFGALPRAPRRSPPSCRRGRAARST